MQIELKNIKQFQKFAEKIGEKIRTGDVIILSGNLGSGKTTFTKSLAKGLCVAGIVTSPTFIIARKHLSVINGPNLVHIDAYRLNSLDEFYDLDIDSELDNSAIVIEWGKGFAEYLSKSYIIINIEFNKSSISEKRLIKIDSINSIYFRKILLKIIEDGEWIA